MERPTGTTRTARTGRSFPSKEAIATGGLPHGLALEGAGMVALSVASKPLPLAVTPDLPVSVPSSSIITWSGGLTPHVVEDRQLYEMVLSSGNRSGALIRLEGTGRVLVEQSN